MSIPKQVYTYWEGVMPPFIDYCIKSIRDRSGVKVIFLNPGNLQDYMDASLLNPLVNNLRIINQRVDCYRMAVLYKHGGMWCDADTLFLRDCSSMFDIDTDFAGFRWPHNNSLLNGYFFAKPQSKFLRRALEIANERMESNKRSNSEAQGCDYGEALFFHAAKEVDVGEFPITKILPVQFPTDALIWLKPNNIYRYLRDETVAVGMNYSHCTEEMKQATIDEIVQWKNLFGSLFRFYQSMEFKKQVVAVFDIRKNKQSTEWISETLTSIYDYCETILVVGGNTSLEISGLINEWELLRDSEKKTKFVDVPPSSGVLLHVEPGDVWKRYCLERLLTRKRNSRIKKKRYIRYPFAFVKEDIVCFNFDGGTTYEDFDDVYVENFAMVTENKWVNQGVPEIPEEKARGVLSIAAQMFNELPEPVQNSEYANAKLHDFKCRYAEKKEPADMVIDELKRTGPNSANWGSNAHKSEWIKKAKRIWF